MSNRERIARWLEQSIEFNPGETLLACGDGYTSVPAATRAAMGLVMAANLGKRRYLVAVTSQRLLLFAARQADTVFRSNPIKSLAHSYQLNRIGVEDRSQKLLATALVIRCPDGSLNRLLFKDPTEATAVARAIVSNQTASAAQEALPPAARGE